MHVPVLVDEVLHFLNPKSNENFIDCTAGGGGHTREILKKTEPEGRVLAFEWDKGLCERLKKDESERFLIVNESYTRVEEVVKEKNFFPVHGVLFDLGFSSFHVDESGRGFSFREEEPLDMRYNEDSLLTAKDIVNRQREEDLVHILHHYSRERYAEEIVRAIVKRREKKEINTTKELREIIENAVPEHYKRGKIHCATKTFQALRIAVNAEILGLEVALEKAFNVMEDGGRLVVICFHAGEEKVVNKFLKKSGVEVLTESPVRPAQEEVKKNIRSRSAKLYAITKK